MVKNYPNPYAVIIGLDSIQGLQAARILSDRKVPIIGVAGNLDLYFCSTRVCEEILQVDTGTDQLIELLVELGPKLQQKAVLLPCQEKSVLMVSRERAQLAPWYHINLPAHELVKRLLDKVSFYAYAQSEGFPISQTCFLASRMDAENATRTLNYPAVLKPTYRSQEWVSHSQQKAFKIGSAEELVTMYERHHRFASQMVAQEWIEGPDSNLYSCICYFDKNHLPVVTFTDKKIRQWLPLVGHSSLGEECRNDHIREVALRLFRSLNYRGLGQMEFKRDERNGKYFIVETNIGRPTGRAAIAEAGGVELHYTMYCDALGWPLPENREQKYTGVKWIHFLRDLRSSAYYYKKGELSLSEWRRSISGRKVDAVFSWKDPLPFLNAVKAAIPVFLSEGRRDDGDG
ncbi:MAG: carboxylate--amine ligase [Chloroflexi bacterium]|nr:MAG: carboxylate--amine ligase [Chloroflexota bacterium]